MSLALPGKMNAAILIEFLKRLISGRSQKIAIMVNKLIVNSAITVNEWMAEYKNKIEVSYVVKYVPEWYSDEGGVRYEPVEPSMPLKLSDSSIMKSPR